MPSDETGWPTWTSVMAARIRSHDWAATPLGPIDRWTEDLKAVVDLILGNRLPMALLWGPELLQVYNDSFDEILGNRHPQALGQPARVSWPEAWHINQPLLDRTLAGETLKFEDALCPVSRNGRIEDAWFTGSYAPLRDETGSVAGVVLTLIETTGRVRAEAARRAAEERMRLIIESVADYAIVAMDPAGQITSWNPGAERLFGYSAPEAIGQTTAIIFTPEDRRAGTHLAEMNRAAADGRAEDERWHVRKNGQRFFVSGVLFPLRSPGTLTGFVKVARDATDRKRFDDAMQQAHQELEGRVRGRTSELAAAVDALQSEVRDRRLAEEQTKHLFAELMAAQEEERHRIAREIHDHVGQQMTALRMNLETLRAAASPNTLLGRYAQRIQHLAEELDRSIDFVTSQLRPPSLDHLGLAAALAQLVAGWSEQFGITADYEMSGMDAIRLSPDAETNLYRIAQEALHNIYKHSGASRVTVFLRRREDGAVLVIEDDGRGFDPGRAVAQRRVAGGLGLASMRERATLIGGELEIETEPGHGTTIFVRVPVSDGSPTGG